MGVVGHTSTKDFRYVTHGSSQMTEWKPGRDGVIRKDLWRNFLSNCVNPLLHVGEPRGFENTISPQTLSA